jgi:hypothetical protein
VAVAGGVVWIGVEDTLCFLEVTKQAGSFFNAIPVLVFLCRCAIAAAAFKAFDGPRDNTVKLSPLCMIKV